MNRIFWIITPILFILLTVMALFTHNPNSGRRVKFTNVNFAIRNSNSEITNVMTTNSIPSSVKYIEKQTTSTNMPNMIQTKTEEYITQNNSVEYDTTKSSSKITYKNLDASKYDKILKEASKIDTESQKKYDNSMTKYNTLNSKSNSSKYDINDYNTGEYVYDNIDWSKWKSNFVNRILDDSMAISELDEYPNGAFFYYSFSVTSQGSIYDINVRSVYLSEADKQRVKDLIKSYTNKPITKFPPRTNRKTAKVSAIMMLSNSETNYSKPSDFNDNERIKYKR